MNTTREQQSAQQKDAVLQASIDFISTLTGMTPPPIEVAPPEVFAPFKAFADRVCAIFSQHLPSPAWCALVDAELAATEEADALVSPSLGPWNPIGTAPKNQKLIVGYRNKLGYWRTVMARHYPSLTLLRGEEVEWDDDDIESAYAPPGWYEEVESHETIRLTDRVPTHWMYLPGEPVTPAITLPAAAVAEGAQLDGDSLEQAS